MSEETPINLHSEPDGLQGRPALLQLVTITKKWVDQSKAQVKCNLCEKVMAGTTERMAAHFAKGSNFGVAKCTRSTSEATARGKKVLGEFEAKWAATRKRKAEHSIVESRKTFLRCKDNGEGKEAANKTFLRFLLAPGQSFSIGESPYFRDFVTAVSKVPGWTARERRTLAGTDIDGEYRKVDVESKARLERNGLQRGKTLQTDGMTTKLVSGHGCVGSAVWTLHPRVASCECWCVLLSTYFFKSEKRAAAPPLPVFPVSFFFFFCVL